MKSRSRPARDPLHRPVASALAAVLATASASTLAADVKVTIYIFQDPAAISDGLTCKRKVNQYVCVDTEPVDLTRAAGSSTVTWAIGTPGWSFDAKKKGVDIKDNSGTWTVTPVGATFTATSPRRDGIIYKYRMDVVDNGGTTPMSWDPTIMN